MFFYICSYIIQYLGYQVPKEDILKDLWIFKYAVMNIENKLQFAQENNIQTIKTWMIRVPTPTLEK